MKNNDSLYKCWVYDENNTVYDFTICTYDESRELIEFYLYDPYLYVVALPVN